MAPSNGVNGTDPAVGSSFTSLYTSKRDRPLLLPSNRRLRHLQGISLRNLDLSHPSRRNRGLTNDDGFLPQSWKSPAKLLAQQEQPTLGHSRSSTDLSSLHSSPTSKGKSIPNGSINPNSRPGGRLRRRSTLNWSGASPATRQKKLEDLTSGRMADVWFSVHVAGIEGRLKAEPVYVSEVAEKAMNPNFQFFDLNSCGPLVSRQDEITVKFWVLSEGIDDCYLLLELQLSLRSLQFIGRSLESFHHPLPPNCVVFFLSDGVYTNLTDMAPRESPIPLFFRLSKSTTENVQPTSSYDALMRLSTLDDCIQDALITRERLASQINSILKENQESLDIISEAAQMRESLATTKRYLAAEKKKLKAAIKRRADLKASLEARKEAMRKGREAKEKAQNYLDEAALKLKECKILVEQTIEDIQGQIRRISEDLMGIYPIEPIPNRTLSFQIRSLPLPNSDFDSPNTPSDDTMAAALGYVTHLTYLLSFYLRTPLLYPLAPHSSTSFVQDPISLMPSPNPSGPPRTFPLYPRGTVRYRFEYAVFLLNKDIEQLMSEQGLKVLDIRHTLPNLKYLLYILSAGRGDLPARKAGGVRGLLSGRAQLSRRGSEDSSVSGGAGEAARKSIFDEDDGKRPVAGLSGKGKGVGYSGVRDGGGSLRTSALREMS